MWTATWQSSFQDCENGYSTFISNSQESKWAADQLLQGPGARLETVPALIERIQQQAANWHREDVFQNLEHQPKLWPQLLRGRGLLATKGPYHDKAYRRLTVEKIKQGAARDEPVALEVGPRGPYASVFVLPKVKLGDYDQDSMRLLSDLFFADSVKACANLFPKVGEVASWSTLRMLLAKFVVCGKVAASTKVHDLGREGMIKGVTEHSEYLRYLLGDPLADFATIRPVRQPKHRKRVAVTALDGLATPKRSRHDEEEALVPARQTLG